MINFIFLKIIETSLKQLFHVFDKINKKSVCKTKFNMKELHFLGHIFQMMR